MSNKIITLGASVLLAITVQPVGAFAAENHANSIEQNSFNMLETNTVKSENPDVIEFLKEINQVLILDENNHALYLTEEATTPKIEGAYRAATVLLTQNYDSLTEEDRNLIFQLSNELLRAMHNEVKKQPNDAYDTEKINAFNQLIDDLFVDYNKQILKDSLTENQLIELFQDFLEFKAEARERDEKTNTTISDLFKKLNQGVIVWTNNLEERVEDLVLETGKLNSKVSESEITSIANDIEGLPKLGVDSVRIEKLKVKIAKAQELFELISKDESSAPNTTDQASTIVEVYRLYNANTGEHFYTKNSAERANLKRVGWRDEGLGWNSATSGKAVYRVYNPNAKGGDHYYTMSKWEAQQLVDKGWHWDNNGAPAFYSNGSKNLYVAYNPNATSGAHNYTTSSYEQNYLLKNGWIYGTVAWKVK
ncbi:hypothetical protein [Lactococcus taiwanensis]|uniref:hypothetical protein n=1 Tax=Lactococcus taiwanensis TaxID=1151742 RepID=UPI00351770F6